MECRWELNAKNTELLVIQKILQLLNEGFTNKDEIVSKVAVEFNFAKPIIRRIMTDMRIEMQRKIRVLSKEYEKDSKHE